MRRLLSVVTGLLVVCVLVIGCCPYHNGYYYGNPHPGYYAGYYCPAHAGCMPAAYVPGTMCPVCHQMVPAMVPAPMPATMVAPSK